MMATDKPPMALIMVWNNNFCMGLHLLSVTVGMHDVSMSQGIAVYYCRTILKDS